MESFRLSYGPANRAFDSLDPEEQRQLRRELEALWSAHNSADDRFTRVQTDWLGVTAIRA